MTTEWKIPGLKDLFLGDEIDFREVSKFKSKHDDVIDSIRRSVLIPDAHFPFGKTTLKLDDDEKELALGAKELDNAATMLGMVRSVGESDDDFRRRLVGGLRIAGRQPQAEETEKSEKSEKSEKFPNYPNFMKDLSKI